MDAHFSHLFFKEYGVVNPVRRAQLSWRERFRGACVRLLTCLSHMSLTSQRLSLTTSHCHWNYS